MPGVVYYIEDININGKVTRHGPIEVFGGMRERRSSRAIERP